MNPRRKLKPIVLNESPVARYLQKLKKGIKFGTIIIIIIIIRIRIIIVTIRFTAGKCETSKLLPKCS
jgi:hypothetical protein